MSVARSNDSGGQLGRSLQSALASQFKYRVIERLENPGNGQRAWSGSGSGMRLQSRVTWRLAGNTIPDDEYATPESVHGLSGPRSHRAARLDPLTSKHQLQSHLSLSEVKMTDWALAPKYSRKPLTSASSTSRATDMPTSANISEMRKRFSVSGLILPFSA
jgi:hypothetical protein